MKHLLNNIPENEKNRIRKQHKGGVKLIIENFQKLVNTELGSVKPLLEQENEHVEFLEKNYVSRLTQDGFKVVSKINLPNGEYKKQGGGYRIDLYDKDGKTFTGYSIVTNGGIRGMWNNQSVSVNDGTIGDDTYKILFKDSGYKAAEVKTIINTIAKEGIKNVSEQMISSPPFAGTWELYKFGGVFEGVNYVWDGSGIEGMIGIRDTAQGEVICERNNILSKQVGEDIDVSDAEPNAVWVGFLSVNGNFVIYLTKDKKFKVAKFR